MKIVTASNNAKNLQISRAEWLRIGSIAGWTKTAQPDPRTAHIIDVGEVAGIVESMGSKRFMIGYRKKDGSFRTMHAQRSVNKYTAEDSDPSRAETRQEHGLVLVYDLDVARKLVGQIKYLESDTEEDRAKRREIALRKAYRSIYPQKIEMIRGLGQTWLVNTAENPDIQRMIDDIEHGGDPGDLDTVE